MESFIQHYGYLAILLGTFLEGETILVLSGFAAHRGYLHLPWVITAAFLGTLLGDQLFFYLGRRHSEYLLKRRPHWRLRLERTRRLIHSYRILLILGFRFLYGLRTITPFALGMSQVSWQLFLPLNILGAAIWAVCFGCAGYLFGHAVEIFLGDVKQYEYWLFSVLAGGGCIFWIIHRIRHKS
ncbi:DedA family protein [uncultured Desulfuromusa sp.]|uniref:DedA family protein n=1 Tax=uncultured Desulfuromusa sp. TaxID=219183 RepID=UPI002AA95E3F|nr:DedA family protein [uncultured Desulfuromusa sp.]